MSSWIMRGLATWIVVVLPAILGTAIYFGTPARALSATILWSIAFTTFMSWFWTGVEVRDGPRAENA